MVNSLRPRTRSPSVLVHQKTATSTSQDEPLTAPQHHPHPTISDTITVASSITDEERPRKRIKISVRPQPTPPKYSNASSRATRSNTPVTRPPTKLTVEQPHGKLLQITNGVRRSLNVREDEIPSDVSQATTPDPSAPQKTGGRNPSERRSLRSQDEGTRLKSELAVYFPNYEDVIYDVPQEVEFITPDTTLYVFDAPIKPTIKPPPTSPSNPFKSSRSRNRSSISHAGSPSQCSPNGLSHLPNPFFSPAGKSRNANLNGAQMVDFSSISTHVPSSPSDPLSDSFYFKAHRRAERKEKQLRNIERERAFYEKGRLESLLDGLRGYDWMRVMGIHSSTEAESKKFERKRDYFIAEVEALLLKFKQWKDEERRLKLEKEAAALVEEEEDDEEETGAGSDGEPPSSEIDESAARQLQREMSHSSAKVKGKQTTTSVDKPGTAPQQPKPRLSGGIVLDPQYLYQPEPDTPFTSFYSKPHLRAAALGKARHGRNVTAFGQPIPEPEEREFQLPDEYVTPDALKASARNRRRLKRESAVDKKGR